MVPRWAVQLLRPWLFKIPLPQVGMRRGLLGDDAPPDEVAELVEEQRRCRPEVLAARLRDVLSVDVRDDFKQIDVPILYLRGTRDRVVPSRVGQELQQLQPDIRMATLHSAHAVLQRKPTEAAAVIGQFLLSGMMPQISNRRGTIGRLRSSY
jgi:pimeloyl-ACP methyl ester carboxylesterase